MTDKKTTAKKKESIHQALFRFHSLFHGAQKSGTNLHFKSTYFTLDDLVTATTPVLQECGLFVLHMVHDNSLTTCVYNAAGDEVHSRIDLPRTENPQIMGSNLTYFKKYNLTGLLNIPEASDLDDDGNAGADAANLGERAKKERKARPPQAGATDQQIEGLREYQAKYALNDRQNDYIDANIEKLTILDAADLIKKLDEAKAAGTLKLKEKGNE